MSRDKRRHCCELCHFKIAHFAARSTTIFLLMQTRVAVLDEPGSSTTAAPICYTLSSVRTEIFKILTSHRTNPEQLYPTPSRSRVQPSGENSTHQTTGTYTKCTSTTAGDYGMRPIQARRERRHQRRSLAHREQEDNGQDTPLPIWIPQDMPLPGSTRLLPK